MFVEYEEIESDGYGGEVRRVVEECLGETYADNVVSLGVDDGVLMVARVDGRVVGFACGFNSDSVGEYVDCVDDDFGARSVLEKNAVLPEFRGEGIGSRLTEERLERLEQPTVVESWVRSDGDDSSSVLERFGFEEIVRVEERWYEESLEAQDEEFCPDCGMVCRCDAVVYYLDEF